MWEPYPAKYFSTEEKIGLAVRMQHIHKISIVEMRILIWIRGKKSKDRIQNKEIRLKIGIAPIDEKMRESRFVEKRTINAQ